MTTRERVDLELIDDNPWQPRHQIDEEEIKKLAESIYQEGLLQTPLARRTETGRIQTAFGHRRVAACRLLHQQERGEQYVELDIAELTDERMVVLALTENESRKQLSQIEVVRAYKRAIGETDLTVQALADKLAIDRSTLSNNLRILDLPDFVLEHVESGALRTTNARNFLVLQNADHAHTEDMRAIVDQIVNPYYGRSGPPDWSRRNVRAKIADRVSYNETDYRPLGPRPQHSTAGAAREASFDVDSFTAERPHKLHTIPVGVFDGESTEGKYDETRLWTCDVKPWRTLQTRATREANKEAAATGGNGGDGAKTSPRSMSRDDQFEQVLSSDRVFKRVIKARAKAGPNRPVTDEEREQLGTRAELRTVESYGGGFWKILQKGNPEDVHDWQREEGGHVPPFFPDLKECQECTIGAAYGKSRNGYGMSKPTLVCVNREHYQEKLKAGEAEYRGKLDAQRKGNDRQDGKAAERLAGELESLSDDACRALAVSMLAAEPTLEWLNPLGVFHRDWSYETGAAARIRELLVVEAPNVRDHWARSRGIVVDVEPIADLAAGEVRELVAALVTHHLRVAGKTATVSLETVAV